MSEYKPVTVKEWREFVARNQGAGGSLSRAHSKMLGKEFDRTIAEVRAEAWDEGRNAEPVHDGDHDIYCSEYECFCGVYVNPYREETE